MKTTKYIYIYIYIFIFIKDVVVFFIKKSYIVEIKIRESELSLIIVIIIYEVLKKRRNI